jgi:hypothetical protein
MLEAQCSSSLGDHLRTVTQSIYYLSGVSIKGDINVCIIGPIYAFHNILIKTISVPLNHWLTEF